jgi:DNA repair exonuclease SbcCD ATPase subunit
MNNENQNLLKSNANFEKMVAEKTSFADDKEKLIVELQTKFEELSADFNQKELMAEELDRLRAEMVTEEQQLTRKEMELSLDKQKDEIFLLTSQFEEVQSNLTDVRIQKDELIQKLTESEESKLQIQSEAKQMADELVAQYNRFQTEQAELKSSLEKEHSNQSKEKAEQFESEKNTLLQNFSEKYQKLESENETASLELKNQIEQIREENDKFQKTISDLENELTTSAKDSAEKDLEMDTLTQDLADLIPVPENLN